MDRYVALAACSVKCMCVHLCTYVPGPTYHLPFNVPQSILGGFAIPKLRKRSVNTERVVCIPPQHVAHLLAICPFVFV